MNIGCKVKLVKEVRDNMPPIGAVGEVIQVVDSENEIYKVFFNEYDTACNLHTTSVEPITQPERVYNNCVLNDCTFL